VKDPLEDLLQSVEAILIAYAQALAVDFHRLAQAQDANDAALAQEILQDAFRTDLRPLVAEARLRDGGALHPIRFFRETEVRSRLVDERGSDAKATGL
jgi:L-rhamnose isomerase/sugar isomerase